VQRLGRPVALDGAVDGLLEAEHRSGGVGGRVALPGACAGQLGERSPDLRQVLALPERGEQGPVDLPEFVDGRLGDRVPPGKDLLLISA
jgi:hypothetical protein